MKNILCGAPAREKRDQMVEMREERDRPAVLAGEIRADDDTILEFSGYASTFEPYEMYGGPAKGGWIEQLDRTAFDKTLRSKPDLHLLINHAGLPLARTKSGTLELSVDDGGLKTYAQLDRSDPDVQRIEPKMRRKDMDEMSFAFRVIKQRWDYAPEFEDDPYSLRIIEEVSLHKGDVSIVNFGANPTTSAELLSAVRSLARADLRSLADIDEMLEAEALRGHGDDSVVREAIDRLAMLQRSRLPGNRRSEPVVVDLGSGIKPEVAPKADAARSAAPADEPKPEPKTEARSTSGRKPMSLRDALIRQGLADPAGPMSLREAASQLGETTERDDDPESTDEPEGDTTE